MPTAPDPARTRWIYLTLVRLATAAAAVLGVILLARGTALGQQILGLAIVLVAFWTMAIVPRALARRWRTPR